MLLVLSCPARARGTRILCVPRRLLVHCIVGSCCWVYVLSWLDTLQIPVAAESLGEAVSHPAVFSEYPLLDLWYELIRPSSVLRRAPFLLPSLEEGLSCFPPYDLPHFFG